MALNVIDRKSGKDEWLTPPEIPKALGEFDLDPCSPVNRPWDTAKKHYNLHDDGLLQKWEGRVWLNPPYGDQVWRWMSRLCEHGSGIALIFCRPGTEEFQYWIFKRAHAIFFIQGRLNFYHVSGIRAEHNAGADSMLVSYSDYDTLKIMQAKMKGHLIIL